MVRQQLITSVLQKKVINGTKDQWFQAGKKDKNRIASHACLDGGNYYWPVHNPHDEFYALYALDVYQGYHHYISETLNKNEMFKAFFDLDIEVTQPMNENESKSYALYLARLAQETMLEFHIPGSRQFELAVSTSPVKLKANNIYKVGIHLVWDIIFNVEVMLIVRAKYIQNLKLKFDKSTYPAPVETWEVTVDAKVFLPAPRLRMNYSKKCNRCHDCLVRKECINDQCKNGKIYDLDNSFYKLAFVIGNDGNEVPHTFGTIPTSVKTIQEEIIRTSLRLPKGSPNELEKSLCISKEALSLPIRYKITPEFNEIDINFKPDFQSFNNELVKKLLENAVSMFGSQLGLTNVKYSKSKACFSAYSSGRVPCLYKAVRNRILEIDDFLNPDLYEIMKKLGTGNIKDVCHSHASPNYYITKSYVTHYCNSSKCFEVKTNMIGSLTKIRLPIVESVSSKLFPKLVKQTTNEDEGDNLSLEIDNYEEEEEEKEGIIETSPVKNDMKQRSLSENIKLDNYKRKSIAEHDNIKRLRLNESECNSNSDEEEIEPGVRTNYKSVVLTQALPKVLSTVDGTVIFDEKYIQRNFIDVHKAIIEKLEPAELAIKVKRIKLEIVQYLNRFWSIIIGTSKPVYVTKKIYLKNGKLVATCIMHLLNAFRDIHANIFVNLPEKNKEGIHYPKVLLTSLWLPHEARRTYDSFIFRPLAEGLPTACTVKYEPIEKDFNCWQGFEIDLAAATPFANVNIKPLLNHIREIWCKNNDILYYYVLGWMASIIQKPWIKTKVALVVQGAQGSGKGVVVQKLIKIMSRQHAFHFKSTSTLTSRFNSHFKAATFIFMDEASFAGRKEEQNLIKGHVTESLLQVEEKNVTTWQQESFFNFIFASNNSNIISAENSDRRFCCFETDNKFSGPQTSESKAYFDKVEAVPAEAFAYFLYKYNLEGFNVASFPKTDLHRDQKKRSMNKLQLWWLRNLEDEIIHKRSEQFSSEDNETSQSFNVFHDKDSIYQSYCDFAGFKRAQASMFWKELRVLIHPNTIMTNRPGNKRSDSKKRIRISRVQFPDLQTCKIAFKRFIHDEKWDFENVDTFGHQDNFTPNDLEIVDTINSIEIE